MEVKFTQDVAWPRLSMKMGLPASGCHVAGVADVCLFHAGEHGNAKRSLITPISDGRVLKTMRKNKGAINGLQNASGETVTSRRAWVNM
jgi:hypothetical protein